MAKKKTTNANGGASPEGTAGAKHNVVNRNELMTGALSDTYALDCQIQAALDKHVKPLRKNKADIKSRLNKDLNITATVFNARYVPYRLEAQARAAGDDSTLGNLEELFKIAPVGTQAEMFGGGSADATAPAPA